MSEPQQYWFRARRHGWGWGLPSSRPGWVFFLLWLAALLAGLVLLGFYPALLRVMYLAVMTLVLVIVCYRKGEPPSWRWGDRQ